MFKPIFYIIIFIILSIENGIASDGVIRFLDSKSEDYAAMSKTIWSLAEGPIKLIDSVPNLIQRPLTGGRPESALTCRTCRLFTHPSPHIPAITAQALNLRLTGHYI